MQSNQLNIIETTLQILLDEVRKAKAQDRVSTRPTSRKKITTVTVSVMAKKAKQFSK